MKIPRHNLAVRFTHWVTALSIFVLFFTGFGQMPVYKRYNVEDIPGLAWSSDFLATLNLHYIAAAVLLFISTFYITYLVTSKQFDILPRKGDVRESLQIIKALLGLAQEPENDKYLTEQRLAFAVTAVSIAFLILSGFLKVYKNLPGAYLSPEAVFWTAMIHNVFTVILLFSVVFHLLAFILKPNRPLVSSMFTGTISREYAARRHSRWMQRMKNSSVEQQPEPGVDHKSTEWTA